MQRTWFMETRMGLTEPEMGLTDLQTKDQCLESKATRPVQHGNMTQRAKQLACKTKNKTTRYTEQALWFAVQRIWLTETVTLLLEQIKTTKHGLQSKEHVFFNHNSASVVVLLRKCNFQLYFCSESLKMRKGTGFFKLKVGKIMLLTYLY